MKDKSKKKNKKLSEEIKKGNIPGKSHGRNLGDTSKADGIGP
ncbi:MAG: hypothetical protein ACOX4V_06010 [Anaerovoracaceae bacterium]|jgi:hypothetical protein